MGNVEVANKNECATRNEYAHDEFASSFLSVISSTGVRRVLRFNCNFAALHLILCPSLQKELNSSKLRHG